MNIFNEIVTKATVWSRERRRWSTVNSGAGPRVFYGFDNIGSRGTVVSGGIVKVQDLQEVFPNCVDAPNLLYLVSSSLPPYAPLMVEMAKRRGARFILNQNGVAYPAWHGAGWEKTNASNRLLVQLADHVMYQSRFCKDAADHFLGPCLGGWEILYNPVDTEMFKPSGVQHGKGPVILLLAGSHCETYRVKCALETVAALGNRDIHLVIAGRYKWIEDETVALSEAKRWANDLGVSSKVEFRGAYTQEDALKLFQECDILVHSKYNDPCPRLVVEAMACGLPVVFSASGGVPELVGPSGGVGVPAPLDWEKDHPPAPERMAEGVLKIVTDYRSYSESARNRVVKCFDVRPWVEKHRVVFQNLLKV